MTMTREQVAALLDGTTPGPWTVRCPTSQDGFMIYDVGMYGVGEAWNINGSQENEANARLIAAAPDLARTVIALHAQLADAKAAQAMVVERLRVPLQFMVDSIAEDKAYVAEKYPILFALIQARRAEMGTLGGVQVFGEIARDLLGILTADPSGVEALAALRVERDDLAKVIDDTESHYGLSSNGNMWRFWADKARETAQNNKALRANRDHLAAELAEARAQVEALERERDAACKVADGYKADFHAALVDDDGRPCNTDVFLDVAIRTFSDKWDLYEAVKDWVEGDWDGALVGIDRAALAAAEETKP